MAEISFLCPACGQSIEVDANLAGQKSICPLCSKDIVVPNASTSPGQSVPPDQNTPPTATPKLDASGIFAKSKNQAQSIFNDLKAIKLKEEILPLDASNLHIVLKDFVFWAVTLLGIVPLLIVTVASSKTQLTMFALFFAFVWGVIFKYFVLKDQGPWKWPLASLFFTGIIGLALLLAIYEYILPDAYLSLWESDHPIVSLFGFIFHVGIWEELCKALPILIFLIWKRKTLKPWQLVSMGIFSGLGFAAFENLQYGVRSIVSSYELTSEYGVEGLVHGVQNAMISTMLRSVSLVFCHAVWSGIVGYFIAIALIRKQKTAALIIIGFSVASVLHGVYDWLAGMHPTLAAVWAGFSFALFYGYLSKLTTAVTSQEQNS